MVALPNPSFEPKTTRWHPGAGAPSWDVPSQKCTFCAPKQPFLAQNGPKTQSKRPKRRQTVATLHVHLEYPVTKSLFLPSDSSICPRKGQKMAKNGLNVRRLGQTSPKPRLRRILGYVAQNPILRAPSPRATPHFLWFPSLIIAQRDAYTPTLVVIWWSRRVARPAHGGGQRWGKKKGFPKFVPRPLGMLKQVFLAHCEPVVTRFGPWKFPKCLEKGPFWGRKMGQKWVKTAFLQK